MRKQIIISSIIGFGLLSAASAADYMSVKNISYVDGNTKVSTTREAFNRVLNTQDFTFEGLVSTQDIVNKISMFCDNTITVRATSASSTTGKVQELAKLRSNAWYQSGLTGYFTELTRQINLVK